MLLDKAMIAVICKRFHWPATALTASDILGNIAKEGNLHSQIFILNLNIFWLKVRKIIYADAFFSAPCLRHPHIFVSQGKVFLLYLAHVHHIDHTGCFLWSMFNANNITKVSVLYFFWPPIKTPCILLTSKVTLLCFRSSSSQTTVVDSWLRRGGAPSWSEHPALQLQLQLLV